MPRTIVPPIDRLMSKITVDENGCWIFGGHLTRKGYGSFWVDGSMRSAHRVSYECSRGLIAEGLQLDHLCRVRACCNPAHLEPVTAKENVHRGDIVKSRTHCPNGHEYTPDNLKINSHNGGRQCRECARAYMRTYKPSQESERK